MLFNADKTVFWIKCFEGCKEMIYGQDLTLYTQDLADFKECIGLSCKALWYKEKVHRPPKCEMKPKPPKNDVGLGDLRLTVGWADLQGEGHHFCPGWSVC